MAKHYPAQALNESVPVASPAYYRVLGIDGQPQSEWIYFGDFGVVSGSSKTFSRSSFDAQPIDVSDWRNPTAYSISRTDHSSPMRGGYVQYRPKWSREYRLYGFSVSSDDLPATPAFNDNALNKALTKARLNLNSGGVNLAMEFSQVSKTAAMFGDSLSLLVDTVKTFKKKKPKGFRQLADGATLASSGFLSYVYGWKPEIQAVHDSMAAIRNRGSISSQFRITIKGKSGSIISTASRDVYDRTGLFLSGQHVSDYFMDRYYVSLTYRLRNPAMAELNSTGILNPAVVLWDRIPFSFVVDWFVPVSSWFENLSADFGWDFVAGCKSRRLHLSSQSTGTFVNRWDHTNTSEPYFYVADTYDRSVYGSNPYPSFYYQNPLSALHVAEALALGVTSMKRVFDSRSKTATVLAQRERALKRGLIRRSVR